MHEFEFEFEVRISDQIQTVKMAVGRHLKCYFEYCEFSFAKNIRYPLKNNCARMRSLKSELAKLTPALARQARESHAAICGLGNRKTDAPRTGARAFLSGARSVRR
jgi:hypothetical protein